MKYEEYKDSGVEWMGIVPSHWVVCKLKHKYQFKTGATPSSGKKEFYDGELKWANISDINGSTIYDTAKHITEEAVKSCSMTISPKGSLLYSFKLSVGQVAFCGDDMYTNEAIATFESKTQNLRYLYYIAPQFIIHNANRNIYNAPLLNQDLIKNAIIVLPPIEEQNKIVTYLDKKCKKIDCAIETQKKKIDLLNELKQTIITNAITKGIKPNTPMKSSEIEWIGDIPEHWEIKRLKYLTYGYKAGPFGSSLITSNLLDEGNILVYTPEHIANKSSEIFGNLYLPEERAEEMSQFAVSQDDVIFPIVGTLGRAMIITEEMPSGIINQRLAKFKITSEISSRYFMWLFGNSNFYSHYINLFQRGSIIVNLTKEIVGNMPTPVPPISEQVEIANYLDLETKRIDAQISKANRRIDLLNELKQSIITEAVTGKVKVC